MTKVMPTWMVWCTPKCTKLLRRCPLMLTMKTVSCGAPSNQIAILPLEGKGAPPPDPQLSNYITYFKRGKPRKVEQRDDIVKKFYGHGQEDVLQVIASREEEKGEEGLPESME